jgi:signal recognition particle GTPase
MQGDTGQTKEMPYKGMLAMDEYGTRRVKYWLKHSIEPGLKQLGEVIKEYSQSIYTAHKVFRIVQPNALQEEKNVEINVPMYNDMGNVIGKWRDYETAKFDIRIISGSTLPVNRWAYLSELKELMRLGVVDDIAVLAETDVKGKENIAKRKSVVSQQQQQLQSQEEKLKDQAGTIETLERQLVQAGIKNKVMQQSVEVSKQTHDSRSNILKEELETKAQMKHLRKVLDTENKDKIQRKEDMKKENKALENKAF